jgi:hypothetical protein
MTGVLKATPLASLIAASPFMVLLGIFINHARIILSQNLFHRPTYILDKLPQKLQVSLINLISYELSIKPTEIDLRHDLQFKDAKLTIQPQFDEYSIRTRWLHDFLECSILISGFSLTVLAFRLLAGPYGGLEWALLVGYFALLSVAVASNPKLRISYTLAESAMITREVQSVIEKNSNKTQSEI